jgi:hypothetical protein
MPCPLSPFQFLGTHRILPLFPLSTTIFRPLATQITLTRNLLSQVVHALDRNLYTLAVHALLPRR